MPGTPLPDTPHTQGDRCQLQRRERVLVCVPVDPRQEKSAALTSLIRDSWKTGLCFHSRVSYSDLALPDLLGQAVSTSQGTVRKAVTPVLSSPVSSQLKCDPRLDRDQPFPMGQADQQSRDRRTEP